MKRALLNAGLFFLYVLWISISAVSALLSRVGAQKFNN